MILLDEFSLEATLTCRTQRPRGRRVRSRQRGSRHSPRNRFVAEELHAAGLGTLLMDLSPSARARGRRRPASSASTSACSPLGSSRRSIELGGSRRRASSASVCSGGEHGWRRRAVAAARLPDRVGAVVSRGGRPDLSRRRPSQRQGADAAHRRWRDEAVIDLNQRAMARMARKRPSDSRSFRATHLFEDPARSNRSRISRATGSRRNLTAPARATDDGPGSAVPRSSRGRASPRRGSRSLPRARRPDRPRPARGGVPVAYEVAST
jgi:hypothetical protein